VIVDTTNAIIGGTQIQGITLQRDPACSSVPISVTALTASWTPLDGKSMNGIQVGSNPVEYSGAPIASGGTAPFTNPHAINDGNIHAVTYIQFNTSIVTGNFNFTWGFSDGTVKPFSVNFMANDQQSCLTINLSGLNIGGANNKNIQGITLQNTCTGSIILDRMNSAFTPLSPSRMVKQVQINAGSKEFLGTAGSGVDADLVDFVFPGLATYPLDYIQFDQELASISRNFTIIYKMQDATQKTSTFIAPILDESCLAVTIIGASLGGTGYRDLMGITIQNTCGVSKTVKRIQVTWSPISSRKITQIQINAVNIWTGSLTSARWENITDVAIPSLATRPINYFRFDGDMRGKTFDIIFEMLDNSTKTIHAGPF